MLLNRQTMPLSGSAGQGAAGAPSVPAHGQAAIFWLSAFQNFGIGAGCVPTFLNACCPDSLLEPCPCPGVFLHAMLMMGNDCLGLQPLVLDTCAATCQYCCCPCPQVLRCDGAPPAGRQPGPAASA